MPFKDRSLDCRTRKKGKERNIIVAASLKLQTYHVYCPSLSLSLNRPNVLFSRSVKFYHSYYSTVQYGTLRKEIQQLPSFFLLHSAIFPSSFSLCLSEKTDALLFSSSLSKKRVQRKEEGVNLLPSPAFMTGASLTIINCQHYITQHPTLYTSYSKIYSRRKVKVKEDRSL